MTKVKVCGITNVNDALASIDAGCDALGFVFYKKSPRYINPDGCQGITRYIPGSIVKIGIFVDEKEKKIKEIAKACQLDVLQFHGKETPSFCKRFKGYKIIKAFRIKNKIDPRQIKKYNVFAYMFDTYMPKKIGGTGKNFNWELVKHIGKLRQPVFLSGGLNEKNVKQAIKVAHPNWVDASSSLEVSPGKKDIKKVKKFINAAKGL
ncbi:MAG: phosphoribosylanthranilate isomerase [Candidatus Omnitrophota bacterium]